MNSKVLCIIYLFSGLLIGCSHKKNASILTQKEHRNMFFPSLNSNSISEYRFIYRADRGNYITLAKVTTLTNANLSFLQSFSISSVAQTAMEQNVLLNAMRWRAASLVGGRTNIPLWFNLVDQPLSIYLEERDPLSERQLWRSIPNNSFYLIAIGKQ
jgi:hypothetical protein